MDMTNKANASSVEIVTCIERAWLAPDKANLTQLFQAIIKPIQSNSTERLMPDLQIGKEIKWPMRYMGKQVYAQLVDCGALPNNAVKKIPHNIPNIDWVQVSFDHSTVVHPAWDLNHSVVCHDRDNHAEGWTIGAGKTAIYLETGMDRSGAKAIICILYTKNTDPVMT